MPWQRQLSCFMRNFGHCDFEFDPVSLPRFRTFLVEREPVFPVEEWYLYFPNNQPLEREVNYPF